MSKMVSRGGCKLIKKPSILIYKRSALGLLSLFSLMVVTSFFNIFLEENRSANLFYFLVSVALLFTVGWMAFAFMGKIQLDDQYLLVFRNFKYYHFPLSSVTFYFGKNRHAYRGSYE